jgi:hypothetical protein
MTSIPEQIEEQQLAPQQRSRCDNWEITRGRNAFSRFAVGLLALLILFCGVAVPAQDASPGDEGVKESKFVQQQRERQERLRKQRELIQKRLQDLAKKEEAKKEEQRKREEAELAAANARQPERAEQAGREAAAAAASQQPGAEGDGAPSTLSVQSIQTVLYTRPLDATIYEGDRIALEYYLYNKNEVPLDHYTLAVDFPPWALKPVAIYNPAFEDMFAEQPRIELAENEGILVYSARLAQPLTLKSQPLMTVVWEGLRPVRSTPLRFVFDMPEDEEAFILPSERKKLDAIPGDVTGLWHGTVDRLGDDKDLTDGMVPSTIQVRPLEQRLEIGLTEDGGFVAGRFAPDEALGAVSLEITSDQYAALEGEEFDVRVRLNNPDQANFDTIAVLLEFDPDVLEVVDNDLGNNIRRGINANDSLMRDLFPFDYLHANKADNDKGRLFYKAASSQPMQQAAGDLFQITFLAKKPASVTSIRLLHPDDVERLPSVEGTAITRLGRDIMERDVMQETLVMRMVRDPRPKEDVDAIRLAEQERRAQERAAALEQETDELFRGAADQLQVVGGNLQLIGEEAGTSDREPTEEEERPGVIMVRPESDI